MIPAERESASDDRLTVSIFVAFPAGAGASPDQIRLLQIVRHHRSKSLDLFLPERSELVGLGWVPEIVYAATEHGYSISAVIRPDPEALRASSIVQPEARQAPPAAPPPIVSMTRQAPADPSPPPTPIAAGQDDVLYEVTLRNRQISVNGFALARPNFNSENELVFEYLFRNANRRVELPEIEAFIGRPLLKQLREIVRDLGFSGELRELFFPGVAKTAVFFVNPVTRADFRARDLRPPPIGKSRREKE